ncbi:MAG: HAMP domain-containing sensor histidine kinase, partial [Actinomycetota bacterium]
QGDRVRIGVRDNGIGIEPEFQQRIFELFRRVAPETDRAGTGMGLAICRKIVQAHGGDIGVVSSLGHGTEMWFELPTRSNLEPTATEADGADPTSGGGPSSTGGLAGAGGTNSTDGRPDTTPTPGGTRSTREFA